MKNWLDRVIAWLSPAWAYRRHAYREALRAAQDEENTPPRRPDGGGWMPLNHPDNPLNPDRMLVARGRRDLRCWFHCPWAIHGSWEAAFGGGWNDCTIRPVANSICT